MKTFFIAENEGNMVKQWEKLADRCIRQKAYPDAEDAYRHILEALGSDGHEAYRGRIHFRLGVVLQRQNKLFDAEKELREALEIFRRLEEDDPEKYSTYTAVCEVKLGTVLSAINDEEKALMYFREAKLVVERSDRLRRYFYGQILEGIRLSLIQLGRYAEADNCLEQSELSDSACSKPLFASSHALTAVFDFDWQVSGWDNWDGLREEDDSWSHSLTPEMIRRCKENQLKTILVSIINLADEAAKAPDNFRIWSNLISQESGVGWLCAELGDDRADGHYQRAILLCDSFAEKCVCDADKAEIESLRGLTQARRSVWASDAGNAEEEVNMLQASIQSYREALRCLKKKEAEEEKTQEDVPARIADVGRKRLIPFVKHIGKSRRSTLLKVLAVAAAAVILAGGLYRLAVHLYRTDPYVLPEFVNDYFEREEDRRKKIRWYTTVDWDLPYSCDLGVIPLWYEQESPEILWNTLVEYGGFEPSPCEPGVTLEHPTEEGRRLSVNRNGAIIFCPGTSPAQEEENTVLYEDEARQRALVFMEEIGLDPNDFRYVGTEIDIFDDQRLSRTLPDGTVEYAYRECTLLFERAANGRTFYAKDGRSALELDFLYDEITEIRFNNFTPVPADYPDTYEKTIRPLSEESLLERINEKGIRAYRFMENLKCVTIENVELYYISYPSDEEYKPRLEVSGEMTDGAVIESFTVYIDALE